MKNKKLFLLLLIALATFSYNYTGSQDSLEVKQPAMYQHAPYAEKMCTSCHASEVPNGTSLVSEVPALCHDCHDKFQGDYAHSPSSLGECLLCHNAHESEHQILLNEKEPDLCYLCHDELERKMSNEQNSTHTPAVDSCTVCHSPHISDVSSMLLKKQVKLLCTECHIEEDITLPVVIDSVENKHHPVVTETSCLHCHAPHATLFENHLRAEPLDLCLHCHNKEVMANDGVSLVNIEELLQNNKIHHGPIKEKNCSGCHSPHGSNFYRILLAAYPKEFYTETFDERDYELCFTCHESSLLQDRETTTLTNFRDGHINLHYLHVNKPVKGRTCRACHEIHASNHFNHIRDSVPFGKIQWPLQLKYKGHYTDIHNGKPCAPPSSSCTKSGGSCVACHDRKFYNNTEKE